MLQRFNFKHALLMVSLAFLNIASQNFNFLTGQNNACGYYYFQENCTTMEGFLLNKTIRFSLNIFLIWFVFTKIYKLPNNKTLLLLLVLLGLKIIALFIIFNPQFTHLRFYQILHPMVWSPILPMLIYAYSHLPENVKD